ncbi:MATE family efflux transporter [Bradyrhizobium sp.]|uniref:MATE family efflux transporter n=1 Tax=Bradyrhizobium sp. TaxID=376 RepID=UPI002731D0E9|nr:MATE family efflux transporter [Bradyrhizobium sp.]MDP1866027.1 MATE family efflux transporter [Bradyrhizobium sp.]MDP3077997.1 MATE family efflux transporter [Bradyrhizobium sp.]
MTSLDKTSLDQIGEATAGATTRGSRLTLELTETLKLAVPIALTQLGQIAMMTTDLALVGRLGDGAVAAAALASSVFFMSFTFGMGLVSAVAPLAAQAFGARNPRMVRRSLRVGLLAALMISLPMILPPLYGEQILLALGQAPATARLAQEYLLGLAWGIAPALWFLAIRGFMGAVNRPEPGLWITLVAIPANAVLVYLLIHGEWGLPRLELFGAGLATTIINFGMFLAALWFAHSRRPFRKYHVLGRIWRIDWMLMRQLIVIGAPISISFLLEYGLFSAAALLMGMISTTALAAHQIALQVTAILFMVPFGIGIAATVRVGHAVGRNDAAAVRRAGFVATLLGMALVSALTLAVILARFEIARFFFGEAVESGGLVIELTATLLMVGATFFVADGIQTVAAGALRGMNDTRIPLLFAAISYWLIGFTAAYGLAFWAGWGAIGVWIGLSCGTAVYAILLVLRFRLLANRLASVR